VEQKVIRQSSLFHSSYFLKIFLEQQRLSKLRATRQSQDNRGAESHTSATPFSFKLFIQNIFLPIKEVELKLIFLCFMIIYYFFTFLC
jgi:hypothetical protein